jgi:hypothetical protein
LVGRGTAEDNAGTVGVGDADDKGGAAGVGDAELLGLVQATSAIIKPQVRVFKTEAFMAGTMKRGEMGKAVGEGCSY